jgi:LPXTG-motif cell wall-anchored protein
MLKRLIAGTVAVGALLVLVALPATAQGYRGALPNELTRSGDTCAPGGDLTLTVPGAAPGTDVTFTFDGPPPVVLGVVTADANGTAVLDAVWPDSATPGFHDVTAQGTDDDGDPLPLELVSSVQCGVAGAAAGTLPRTGSDSLPWVRIGVVLVALGGVILLTSRRRSSAVRETV